MLEKEAEAIQREALTRIPADNQEKHGRLDNALTHHDRNIIECAYHVSAGLAANFATAEMVLLDRETNKLARSSKDVNVAVASTGLCAASVSLLRYFTAHVTELTQ